VPVPWDGLPVPYNTDASCLPSSFLSFTGVVLRYFALPTPLSSKQASKQATKSFPTEVE